jgi:hypothetical protein
MLPVQQIFHSQGRIVDMPFSIFSKAAVILSTLGATTALALPATAQAATSAPATHSASTVRPHGEIEFFSGFTYPDTAAGLAACIAKGEAMYVSKGVGSISCFLNNPDPGRYGLMVLVQV